MVNYQPIGDYDMGHPRGAVHQAAWPHAFVMWNFVSFLEFNRGPEAQGFLGFLADLAQYNIILCWWYWN